jgi:hypothetical protein
MTFKTFTTTSFITLPAGTVLLLDIARHQGNSHLLEAESSHPKAFTLSTQMTFKAGVDLGLQANDAKVLQASLEPSLIDLMEVDDDFSSHGSDEDPTHESLDLDTGETTPLNPDETSTEGGEAESTDDDLSSHESDKDPTHESLDLDTGETTPLSPNEATTTAQGDDTLLNGVGIPPKVNTPQNQQGNRNQNRNRR